MFPCLYFYEWLEKCQKWIDFGWKNVKTNEKEVVKMSDVRYSIDKEVQSDVEEKD